MKSVKRSRVIKNIDLGFKGGKIPPLNNKNKYIEYKSLNITNMITNQVMKRPMGKFLVEQRTKDSMFNATNLLKSGMSS